MKISSDSITIAALLAVLAAAIFLPVDSYIGTSAAQESRSETATDSTVITVTPLIPIELDDPSNLAHSANFAWNEFIALTWPAMAQGPTLFPRGQAATEGTYGAAGPTGQVVWETYRHRIEVFPGQGEPNGYDSTAPDYGFNAKPVYRYNGQFVGFSDGLIPPYSGISNPDVPPFNNLDEVTQITLNAMYAGVVDPKRGTNQDTEQEEKILYEAKVNYPIYNYAVKPRTLDGNQYALYDTSNEISRNIRANSGQYLQTGDATKFPPPYIDLPTSNMSASTVGSIEIKAAWRRINTKLEDPSKFYTAPVRYYVGKLEKKFGMEQPVIEGFVDSNDPTVNEVWGLVALHIIHKTPNAPSFVYATFSHNDNILDANGIPVEQPDGTTKPQYLRKEPFEPSLKIVASTPPSNNQKAQKIVGNANTNSPKLYYHNLKGKEVITERDGTTLYSGPVNVNRRIFPIPPTIIAANRAAHAAIRNANSAAVWLNYRLVNVQARPLDLESIPAGEEPTYFLANEVVETNTSLQRFSGTLNSSDGTITDYEGGKKAINMYLETEHGIRPFNMGGCMGCHGSQGQKMGGDFSVIMARGRISKPDIIQEDEELSEEYMQMKTLEFFEMAQ